MTNHTPSLLNRSGTPCRQRSSSGLDPSLREIVAACRASGLEASRAWSSDGRTLRTADGEPCANSVDVLVEGRLKVQAKRRARLANYLRPPPGAHVAIVREDRGEAFAVMPMNLFLRMLTKCFDHTPGGSHE